MYWQRQYNNIKSNITRGDSPDECLKIDTMIGEDKLDVECCGEWATAEDVDENSQETPDNANTSYNQNLLSESAGSEYPTVQHQNG